MEAISWHIKERREKERQIAYVGLAKGPVSGYLRLAKESTFSIKHPTLSAAK